MLKMLKIFTLFILTGALVLSLASCSLLRPDDTATKGPVQSSSDVGGEPDTVETDSQTADTSSEASQGGTEDTEELTDGDSAESSGGTVLPVIPTREPGAPFTVCIDAGHGYVDPGCTTEYLNGKQERDIVAEYAEDLKTTLESRGVRVIMLHSDDEYIDAEKVAAEADKVGLEYMPEKLVDDGRFAAYNRTVWLNVLHRYTYIDAFISIHIDAYTADENVRGTRIYYCSENAYSTESAAFGTALTGALSAALPEQNPRLFPKNYAEAFVVTKHSQVPSVLVEMGFATNPTDAANILDDEWQEKFVTATADGLMAYFGQ